MILTGRSVDAKEAVGFGLANRIVPEGKALAAAMDLAKTISEFPQHCLRNDRLSMMEQWDMPMDEAIANEIRRGLETIESGETMSGASAFARDGKGRHGEFE